MEGVWVDLGLNPFLIRARFQREWFDEADMPSLGLNPFLIRARFQRLLASRLVAGLCVLIPF